MIEQISREVYEALRQFSRNIEQYTNNAAQIRQFADFPYHWCKGASYILRRMFEKRNIESESLCVWLGNPADVALQARGKPHGELEEHCWVLAENLHIDLTYGQFVDKQEYWNRPYIGPAPPFVPGCFYNDRKVSVLERTRKMPPQPTFDGFLAAIEPMLRNQ